MSRSGHQDGTKAITEQAEARHETAFSAQVVTECVEDRPMAGESYGSSRCGRASLA
jgi:hypothetical protein